MSVEITCGKCGEKITNMKMLKSLKDVLNPTNGKCPSCGQKLSTSEFSLDVQEKWSKMIFFKDLFQEKWSSSKITILFLKTWSKSVTNNLVTSLIYCFFLEKTLKQTEEDLEIQLLVDNETNDEY